MAKMELFTIRELHLIDSGELEKDFNDQLKALVHDCINRPGIDKDRSLKLELVITPAKKSDGTCEDVFVQCRTSSKMPSRPVSAYRMAATKNGGLKFQPDSPLDPEAQEEE